MDLLYSRGGTLMGPVRRYSLDMAFGDPEDNDFTLAVPVGDDCMEVGDWVFHPGTEYGGIVDGVDYDDQADDPTVTYRGRTWHGVLSKSILRPDAGSDYLTVSGDVTSVLSSLIDRQGLGRVFDVVPGESGSVTSYRFARYVDAYTGILSMLGSVGMRLRVRKGLGKCELSAMPVVDLADVVDDARMSIRVVAGRPEYNHLVCLGEGELSARTVVDLYLTDDGEVTEDRAHAGEDDLQGTYEDTNADRSDLVEKGTERLVGYYEDSMKVEADIPDDSGVTVGDVVTGRSVVVPVKVVAPVASVGVKSSYDSDPVASYSVGTSRVVW